MKPGTHTLTDLAGSSGRGATLRPARRRVYHLMAGLVIVLAWLVSLLGGAPATLATTPAEVQNLPDLVVEQIILDPADAGAGDTVNITPVIKNQGTASAGGFRIYLYVEPAVDPPTPATTPTTQTFWGLGLAAGATFDGWTRTGQVLTTDNPKIYVIVDPDNQVAESDETNNLFPAQGDSYEDDDTCQQAKAITLDGVAQKHNFAGAGNDEDWVKFTGQSGVTYIIEAKGVGADADPLIELHAACPSTPSFGGGAKITFTAPQDGEYFVRAENNKVNAGPARDYDLSVLAQPSCSSSLEPNNQCAQAKDIGVGAGEQAHNFCATGDVDWFRVETTAGAKYNIVATNQGAQANVQMSLYANCNDAASNTGQQLKFTAAASGYVFLKAENLDPNVAGTNTGYGLKVDFDGTQGCQEDGQEQDDAAAQAKNLAVGTAAVTHNACPSRTANPGEYDWVQFTAEQGKTYTIETLNLGSKADTILCHFSAGGQKLLCDDDGGAGRGSRLTFANATAGVYLLRIEERDPDVAGPDTAYDVRVIEGQCLKDALEPDDERASARAIATDGSAQGHSICAAGEEDWMQFTATANTAYLIETRADGPDADTIIELYDSAGTLLARNDDHTPQIKSQLAYNISVGGTYFVRTLLYNGTQQGAGTEYALTVRPGTVVPTPTPTPVPQGQPTPTPTPQTPQGGTQTLILVNRQRIAELYSPADADALLAKLQTLAQHPKVAGEVIRLDNNPQVSAAYAAWQADITNVDKANALTAEIRNLVLTRLQQGGGIKYVVLAGDDRALPFRRVPDNTPKQSESTYKHVDAGDPTGAAIKANYFLSDAFYVDKEPTAIKNREMYIPDLAIGRLIETPTDMIGTIDRFIAQPRTPVGNMLVTGYDFVDDTAQGDCDAWKTAIGDAKVSCLINGQPKPNWEKADLMALQLRTSAPFVVQSINGHADHYAEGVKTPPTDKLTATEILAAGMDLSGGLIYTLGCHGGLNVPPTNSVSALDLPEAFVRRGANYVGNTGYGWGMLNSVGLSEKLIRLFTTEVLKGNATIGQALTTAKREYFEKDTNISGYDEKVLQQVTFYGLPMFELDIPAALAPEDDFPGVGFDLGEGSLGPDQEVISRTVTLDLTRVLDPNNQPDDNVADLDSFGTGGGSYLALNGSTSANDGEPVQPLHYGDVGVTGAEARGVMVRGAEYTLESSAFDPLIGTPVNEFVPRENGDEATLATTTGLYPPLPATIQALDESASLATELGQFNADDASLRLLSGLELEIIYSTATDQAAPEFTVVDGVYTTEGGRVKVKVGVIDPSGIQEVSVAYIEDFSLASTTVKTLKLSFDADSQKWEGSFTGSEKSRFYVQALDQAGNVATANNKGGYYLPVQERVLQQIANSSKVYLPSVQR